MKSFAELDIITKESIQKLSVYVIYAVLAFLLIFLFFRYLFFPLLPFFLAFAAAALLHRPALRISARIGIPYRIISVLLAVLFVTVLLFAVGGLLWLTVSEIGKFARNTLNGENGLLDELTALLRKMEAFTKKLPFFEEESSSALRENAASAILEMIKSTLLSVASKLPELAALAVSAIPKVLIFFAVTVLSAVYVCMDYDTITLWLTARLREGRFTALRCLCTEAGKTVSKFIRSYAVLFVFTFAELFLGFALLGEPYAFLLALVSAAVDSLPILGIGVVLLPLALYRWITGSVGYAVGVAVLYVVIIVLRQILEPRILGAGMGIHPLWMLIAMYLGLRLFGVIGMFLSPILTVTAKNTLTAFHNTKEARTDAKTLS